MKKRLLSVLLALVMALTLLPIASVAAGDDTPHTHEVDGGTVTFDHAFTAGEGNALLVDGEELEPESDGYPIKLPAGSYRLESDITSESQLDFADDAERIDLCLNGNTMNMNGNCFKVIANKKLTVSDCVGSGVMTSAGCVIDVTGDLTDSGELVMESGKVINTAAEGVLGAISGKGYITLKGGEITGPYYGVYLNHNGSYDKAMLTLVGTPKVSGSKADIYLVESEAPVNTIPFLDATAYTGETLKIEFVVLSPRTMADKVGVPIVKLGDTPADKFSLTNEGYCLQEQTVDGARCLVLAREPHVHAVSVDCETTGKGLVTFTAWDKTDSLPQDSGNYYLTTDVTLASPWAYSEKTFSLCLNGHMVTSDRYTTINLLNSTLDLCDCQGSGVVSSSNAQATIIALTPSSSPNVLRLYGGTVTGGERGMDIQAGSALHMHGGSVKGMTNGAGYGVHLNDGDLFIDGGTISGNTKGVVVGSNSSVFQAEDDARITGNTEANVELERDRCMELSGPLGEHASIGLSVGWWSDVDNAPDGRLLAVQGAGGYAVTAEDFKKLSCDNVKYQLVQDPDGKVYFAPQPDGTVTGTLTGTARSLSWACSPEGTLAVAPLLGQDEAVLAATYDEDGALVGVKKLTADQLTAQVDRDAAKLRLFWLDGHAAPLSPAETAWEKQ